MTWNTLTNLSPGDTLTAGEMDKIRENIEHLGAMKFGATALSALATGTAAARIATGSYTGNGTDDRNITGVGFDPKLVIVYGNTAAPRMRYASVTGDNTISFVGGALQANEIQSLITDGFQVGTGTAVNASAQTYYWVAIG